MLVFSCSKCGRKLEADEEDAGREIQCHRCDAWVRVDKYHVKVDGAARFPVGLTIAGILWIMLGVAFIIDRLLLLILLRNLPIVPGLLAFQLGTMFFVGLFWGGYTSFAGARAIAGKLPDVSNYVWNSLWLGLVNCLSGAASMGQREFIPGFISLGGGCGYLAAALLTWVSASAYQSWLNDRGGRSRRMKGSVVAIVVLSIGIPLLVGGTISIFVLLKALSNRAANAPAVEQKAPQDKQPQGKPQNKRPP